MLKPIKKLKRKLLATVIILLFFMNVFYISSVADFEGRPDLELGSVNFPLNVDEGKEVEFIVKVKNIKTIEGEYGNISSGESIVVALKINDAIVATNESTRGLDFGESRYINVSWTAEYFGNSKTRFSIEVNPDQTISESDVNNNAKDGFIYVSEKNPVLEIIDVDFPELFVYNETASIKVSVRNNGGATTKTIFGLFNTSVDGNISRAEMKDTLERDEVFDYVFNWTPSSFGIQSFSVNIMYNGKSHDYYSKSVVVGAGVFEWWDSNWHYRYLMVVKGQGNISKSFNFTDLLDGLDNVSGVFDNDTIRIVKYDYEGNVIGVVENFNFNESMDFDPTLNATGDLLWAVSGNNINYYCVYFDIDVNPGVRTSLDENNSLISSSAPDIIYEGVAEGWQMSVLEPINNAYLNITGSTNISVKTQAIAENVSVFVYSLENASHNFTLYLTDDGTGVNWSYKDVAFDIEGNWTLDITCIDNAGYFVSENITLYVGRPDIEIVKISIKTDDESNSPTVYLDDTVFVTAGIRCTYASFDDVGVNFSVYNDDDELVDFETTTKNLLKDKIVNVSFEWLADISGKFRFQIFVDYNKEIDEIDESNNILNKTISVYTWPDLSVLNISWGFDEIFEHSSIVFKVTVENKGGGDASDYKIKLYLEPESNDIMSYKNEKDTSYIDLDAGKSKKINLIWDDSSSGRFFVGVKIFVNDTKKDLNISNNRLLSDRILVVSSYESSDPVIENVRVDPDVQEKGGIVKIYADVSDSSGLRSVNISIRDSNGDVIVRSNMFRIDVKTFRYVFTDTDKVDIYKFEIIAVDSSFNKNKARYNDTFEIIEDDTNPVIDFVGAEPYVQLLNKEVKIVCITHDNSGIESVKVIIALPNGSIYETELEEENTNMYIYKDIYNMVGVYDYFVLVIDDSGNEFISDHKSFYVTEDINDADNDGIPDWWEERYGFDPYDKADANDDYDKDGLSNKAEYEGGLNPLKDIMEENMAYRIGNNIWYLIASIIIFLFIISIVYIGRRRKI